MNQVRLVSAYLSGISGVEHAFLTRLLPLSSHIYTELDAVKAKVENPQTIIETNLDIALNHSGFQAHNISMLHQTHSTRVAVVDGKSRRPVHDADAQVTTVLGVALGVLTADCVPVLFADAKNRVIGAAHSGWKGTCNGVLDATIASMKELGAKEKDICAVIGPCIRFDSYEVGPEFIEFFSSQSPHFERYFKPSARPDHYLFNLPGVVAQKLKDLGVGSVEDVGIDTYTNPQTCFSYRRQTHRNEGFQGNLLSLIMLT